MEVRIIKSLFKENWYADLIHHTFFVIDEGDRLFFKIPIPDDFSMIITPLLILKEDCEVLDG